MNKEGWSILGAAIAILLVCLMMAFTSGCEKEVPLEVGQVWEWDWRSDPFEDYHPVRREILALKEGYVQYIRLDEEAKGVIGSMEESPFRACGAKLIAVEDCDVDSVDDVPAKLEVGQVWQAQICSNPFDPGTPGTRKIIALQDGYVQYLRIDSGYGANDLEHSMTEHVFRYWSPVFVGVPTEDEPDAGGMAFEPIGKPYTVEMRIAEEPNTPPQWGKGDLSPEHIKFFGESNGSRLDFIQNQAIDRHTQIIIEIAKRVLILEDADPNDVRLGRAG